MSDDEYDSNNHFNLLTNELPGELPDSSFEVTGYDEDSNWEDSDILEDTSERTERGGSSDEASMLEVPSSGPRRSSPVTGTRSEKAAKRIQKGRLKRQATLEKNKEERHAETARIKAAVREAEREGRRKVLKEILETLQQNGLRFWDLMEYVFNPENGQGHIRYNEFFVRKSNAPRVLDWWMSAKNRGERAKAEVREWAVRLATRTMAQEAQAVTKSKEFQTMGQNIDAEAIKAFNLSNIHEKLTTSLAPTSMRLLASFTTAKGVKKHGEHRKERTKMVCSFKHFGWAFLLKSSGKVTTFAALLCLGEYSHSNNLAKRMIGLYLYATGAQRQCITVLSTLGLSESYTNLTSQNIRRKRKVKQAEEPNPFVEGPSVIPSTEIVQRTGTLHQLSDSMRSQARELAATGLFSVVYDNINLHFGSPEQIIGRHGMS